MLIKTEKVKLRKVNKRERGGHFFVGSEIRFDLLPTEKGGGKRKVASLRPKGQVESVKKERGVN